MAAFSRRRALVGAAFTAFVGAGESAVAQTAPAATPIGADAALLAECAVFMKWTKVRDDLDDLDDEIDEGDFADGGIDAIACDAWWNSLHRIVGMPATTRPGLLAKAEVLDRAIAGICTSGEAHEDLAVSFARDVVAVIG